MIEVNRRDFSALCIQDSFNKRLRIEDYRGNISSMIYYIKRELNKHQLEKVIIKSRYEQVQSWLQHGYRLEATIPSYFNGSTAYLMTFYESQERQVHNHYAKENNLLQKVQLLPLKCPETLLSPYKLRKAVKSDAKQLVTLYKTVFTIYPSPLHDLVYVQSMLEDGTPFFIVEYEEKIVSAAAAEINTLYNNAELTDCATLPSHRSLGLMKHLMVEIERELKKKYVYCVYTIARALSFGVNAAFHQLGYAYSGRLINNCLISTALENMNVWSKDLSTLTSES
ncbi:putative beta-lysine N-acetyltransferase [Priestia flexa]|nr:putative beta-lysine N-acetyltransferase [Priestia flexa]